MDDVLHRDHELGDVCGEALEGMIANELIVEPETAGKVWRSRFKGPEEAIEGEEDKDILLGVAPLSLLLVGQKTLHHLGDQRILRVSDDEGIKKDSVCLPVAVKKEELSRAGEVRVREGSDKVGCFGRLVDTIDEESLDGGGFGFKLSLSVEELKQPSETFHRQAFVLSLSEDGCSLLHACLASQFVLHIL